MMHEMRRKPIRVFFSPLSRRFYASRTYRIDANGLVTVTGEKFDVTDDIASLIEKHNVEFREIPAVGRAWPAAGSLDRR
jgi:hypothetical protein